jgi:hypothetical protein
MKLEVTLRPKRNLKGLFRNGKLAVNDNESLAYESILLHLASRSKSATEYKEIRFNKVNRIIKGYFFGNVEKVINKME